MGLGDWFKSFYANLQVQDGGTISARYKQITKRLNTDFWNTTSETSHSLYVGSYGRNTAIAGFSDLDIIFELPYAEYVKYNGYSSNGQSALLQAVKKSIEKTYSTTSIRADGQVIIVPFIVTKERYVILFSGRQARDSMLSPVPAARSGLATLILTCSRPRMGKNKALPSTAANQRTLHSELAPLP